jgi:hypothetical protein
MRITLNQLKRIIKEEVTKATKRSRKLREAPDVDETELFLVEFTFISPEDEENFEMEYPEYREEGFVLVCDNPEKCAKDFLQRTMAAGALTDYEFQKGTLIGTDTGVVIYGDPEQLTQAGTTFARMDYELGGAGFSYDPSEAPDLVREKMRPVE